MSSISNRAFLTLCKTAASTFSTRLFGLAWSAMAMQPTVEDLNMMKVNSHLFYPDRSANRVGITAIGSQSRSGIAIRLQRC